MVKKIFYSRKRFFKKSFKFFIRKKFLQKFLRIKRRAKNATKLSFKKKFFAKNFFFRRARYYKRVLGKRRFSKTKGLTLLIGFFKRKKIRKDIRLLLKRLRKIYVRHNTWKNRIRSGRYVKSSSFFSNTKHRYVLFNKFRNTKKFKRWIRRRFMKKRKFYVFRMFFFFRKLDSLGVHVRKPHQVPESLNLNDTFFEKYRRFSLGALKNGWYRFHPAKNFKKHKNKRNFKFFKKWKKKTIKFIRKKVKRFKKKKFKKHKNKRNFKFFKKWKKKKFFPKKFFHFLCSRKRYRRTLIVYQFRKRFSSYTKAVERFFRFSSKKNSYKSKPQTSNFFYFLNSTRSLKHSRLVKRPSLSISHPSSQISPLSQTFFNKSRSFRFKRRNPLYFFNARRRFPKIYLRNFSIVRKSPLSFFFMRFSKKHNSIFRVFKPKRLRYKKRIKKKDPRRFRWLRRVKFYQNKIKKFKFNFINRKLFSVKKSYGKFFPYQGFFKNFGKFKFKYRSRRIKFFRYFKKYFSRFSRFSGLPRPKFFYKKKKISKIKIFIHIFRSVNNMFISVSAPKGRNLYSYSAGRTQFRGSKRLSPIAIETMGKTVSSLLYNSKIKKVAVVFHTPVDFLVRALLRGLKSTLNFSSFRYHLNKPHNGLRLRASRRILFIIFRMWCNGNISALGAGAVGSNPAIQIAV